MATTEVFIKPRKGWQPFDFREAFVYRELLAFLIWRDVKIRYRQTLLGGLWSILQPLAGTLIFLLVFNRWAGVHSDGPPYALFAFAGLAPWTFFSNSVTNSSNSLLASQQLVSRVYFPRIFIPLGTIGALLLDLAISLAVLGCMMIYYRWALSVKVLLLPISGGHDHGCLRYRLRLLGLKRLVSGRQVHGAVSASDGIVHYTSHLSRALYSFALANTIWAEPDVWHGIRVSLLPARQSGPLAPNLHFAADVRAVLLCWSNAFPANRAPVRRRHLNVKSY